MPAKNGSVDIEFVKNAQSLITNSVDAAHLTTARGAADAMSPLVMYFMMSVGAEKLTEKQLAGLIWIKIRKFGHLRPEC